MPLRLTATDATDAAIPKKMFGSGRPLLCVTSVRIRNYSGPYFRAFGLNTER